MPKRKSSISKLKKKLDIIFSQYIRLSNADDKGYVKCVTCGVVKKWNKGMQCGHFISRSKLNTRFDEDNCYPQCVGCNVFKSGNMVEYALFMEKKLGMDKVKKMNDRANQLTKLDRDWYEEKIEYYSKLVNEYKKYV